MYILMFYVLARFETFTFCIPYLVQMKNAMNQAIKLSDLKEILDRLSRPNHFYKMGFF